MDRIGGYPYLMDAARGYVCGALDSGAKPAVITAIAKYNFTELGRQVINDAMDISAGAGISLGPRNLFAHNYMAAPIRSEEHTSELQSRGHLVCRLLLEKKN